MLELLDKLYQIGMSFSNLLACYASLDDNLYAMHELAEVLSVFLGEHCRKKSRSQTK
jgi:hypothetical protein